ncbi:MAG: PD-(D/E)XK nuclease family protein, partial [Betaproteobacteria bacterium]|nr:PD-(D/E)XK nuclease family protein [Betaproteobacteria bacterium]
SIYRFRRADARLFGVVREFLEREFHAHYLAQNETRRNAPAVLHAVNGVFAPLPDGFMDFEEHIAHHQGLPGHVEVLPLLPDGTTSHSTKPASGQVAGYLPPGEGGGGGANDELCLRNPLTTPHAEAQSGAREIEAEQFAAHIADIVAHWSVQGEGGKVRRAAYRDIMVLVRKRTHLRVYEHALRARHIPFLTSRRGGLLDTLEAEDIQALLTFLITPFADLQLAQALRSPLFACSDEDLMRLAADAEGSWWSRLQRIAQSGTASPNLLRAYRLMHGWLDLADKLPVHDLLDRIYFEGDLAQRYAAALPAELHETVRANLQAFMEIALNVDAGRYPSLPRFLAELRELRAAENEAPDEGRLGEVGNALRIYTVHEAKGLEAPIVWLLDANDTQHKPDSYGVLLDWPPSAHRPAHFSLFSDKRGCGVQRAPLFDADEAYARREEMNLLYVAMTRAKQALLVSGNGEPAETSWYGRIAQAVEQGDNPLLAAVHAVVPVREKLSVEADAALLHPLPAGQHAPRMTAEQRRGIWLHALLQYLAPPSPLTPLSQAGEGSAVAREREVLQQRCGIPAGEMESLWQQAHHLLALPALQRYFDPRHYRSACNEMPYVNARGELKRIDRLVEFDGEVWVLDYKTSESANPAPYVAQLAEYRAAMQAVYANKKVRCALLFADGTLCEAG